MTLDCAHLATVELSTSFILKGGFQNVMVCRYYHVNDNFSYLKSAKIADRTTDRSVSPIHRPPPLTCIYACL